MTTEHAFGRGPSYLVGIEEELLLVDPESGLLAPVSTTVLAAMGGPHEHASHEAYAAEIELRSPPCTDAREAVAALRSLRTDAIEAGAGLMAAGMHPAGEFGDVELVDAERYRKLDVSARGLIRRTPECALHVHVSMSDVEAAVRAMNGLRTHLPLFLGLAANSPFWFGRDSGLASARASHVRAFPGRGIPPAFGSADEWYALVEAEVSAGGLDDFSNLWWDVRLNPRFGTLEVREMDVQTRLGDAAAIGALVHSLAREAAETAAAPWPVREALSWSSFRAGRDGLDAEIVTDAGSIPRPLREVARETLARLDDPSLEGIERILRDGNGADAQRADHDEGGIPAVVEGLLRRTGELDRPIG